ncbi:hypothetical protein CDAR_599031 [Caerostris darwini]|uniref:Uncharacterized protein n=1 Tax=Caerostris darwini TaxID=1538125 RepID=A0AAV4R6G1_9ARAC|nr:hypothetical protein CDAR_599031 [Caerostris darwini]
MYSEENSLRTNATGTGPENRLQWGRLFPEFPLPLLFRNFPTCLWPEGMESNRNKEIVIRFRDEAGIDLSTIPPTALTTTSKLDYLRNDDVIF